MSEVAAPGKRGSSCEATCRQVMSHLMAQARRNTTHKQQAIALRHRHPTWVEQAPLHGGEELEGHVIMQPRVFQAGAQVLEGREATRVGV